MQGEVISKSVFSEMSEQCDDSAYLQFYRVYSNDETNIMLLWPLAFADMPMETFWNAVRPEKEFPEFVKDFLQDEHLGYTLKLWMEIFAFDAMVTAQNHGCESLLKLCQTVYYGENSENEDELMTELLAKLNACSYSYCVHLSFILVLLKLELITEENEGLLQTAFERHKAGLKVRGIAWRKKRLRRA